MAIDLPGVGLSDPIDLPRKRYRETVVAWLDSLLDALELDAAALLGHSGAGGGRCGTQSAYPGRGHAAREVRGRESDPCRSPGLGRLDGGHGPGPDRRRRRQGRDTSVVRAVRLAVAFWVPASFQRATRRAAP